jgi:hypothetical protein
VSDRAQLHMALQGVGLMPDCDAPYTLPRLMGLQPAKALARTAREIGPRDELALGLVLDLLPHDRLNGRASERASHRPGSSLALSLTKQALHASLQSDLETMLTVEATSQAGALCSEDHRDAVQRLARKEPLRCRWPQAQRRSFRRAAVQPSREVHEAKLVVCRVASVSGPEAMVSARQSCGRCPEATRHDQGDRSDQEVVERRLRLRLGRQRGRVASLPDSGRSFASH